MSLKNKPSIQQKQNSSTCVCKNMKVYIVIQENEREWMKHISLFATKEAALEKYENLKNAELEYLRKMGSDSVETPSDDDEFEEIEYRQFIGVGESITFATSEMEL